jgi:GNAT superfamily N-acetyltransferase
LLSLEYIQGLRPPQPNRSLTAKDQLCKNGWMASVLQLRRDITSRPEICSIGEINVRHYQGDTDVPAWLALRHQAFARQRIGVRQWTEGDFHAEFTGRWWWQPERMWLAEILENDSIGAVGQAKHQLIATATLAMRGEADQTQQARPVVHWLVVHPRWRRRGIARLLMAHLEAAAWDAGYREIWLETHAAWEAAVKFYQSLGYRQVE